MTKYTEEEMQEILQRALEGLNVKASTSNSAQDDYRTIQKIPEFKFDLENGNTFRTWFERYQPQIESDTGALRSTEARAQFITSKLGQLEYNQFVKRILPKKIGELEYEELTYELCLYFDAPTTLFRRRLRLFETRMTAGGLRHLRTTLKSQALIGDMDMGTYTGTFDILSKKKIAHDFVHWL